MDLVKRKNIRVFDLQIMGKARKILNRHADDVLIILQNGMSPTTRFEYF